MLEKIYLHLLILCGILCYGIIAALPDEDTRASSDLLLRKRRVISHLPGGLASTKIAEAPYIVNIKQNSRMHCAGAIMTHHTVITVAPCVVLSVSNYTVLSGSGDDRFSSIHSVKSKLTYHGNFPHQEIDGIALITVDPPFVYSRKTAPIALHKGPLPAGTQATVTGWGYSCPVQPIPGLQRRLRTITLPIMKHEECETVYQNRINITEKYLCTYDANQHCALHDEGAPLVVNGKMAGIHVWKGESHVLKNPDVFVNLQRTDYSEWIREHSVLL